MATKKETTKKPVAKKVEVPKKKVDVKEPKGLAKFNDVVAYWYKRRVEFDKGIEKCRAVERNDEKISCYQELKHRMHQSFGCCSLKHPRSSRF